MFGTVYRRLLITLHLQLLGVALTLLIQESEVRNPDSLDYRKSRLPSGLRSKLHS